MKCDFCTSSDPIIVYLTEPFDVLTPTVRYIDDGGWAACEECAALVADKNKYSLVFRALLKNHVGSVQYAAMFMHLIILYTKFFDGLYGYRPV